MKRRSKYRWILYSLLNLSIHLADGLVTYINTPDLAMEGNPLVAKLGYGWGALFTANLVGFLFVVVMTWTFCRYEHVHIPAKGWFDYYMKLFYGENYKPYWCFYKFSKNWESKLALFCYGLYWGITAAAVFPVLGWIFYMLDVEPAWWHTALYGYITALAVAYSMLIKWLHDGYPESKKAVYQESKIVEGKQEENCI